MNFSSQVCLSSSKAAGSVRPQHPILTPVRTFRIVVHQPAAQIGLQGR